MINKLWTDINLKNYNNWYPLTGIIIETPQQYINTWPNVNDWFTTFAIRAQNDINAYLNFILSKFPFDSFKDELIKETLRDMVYVCIEHWVFNRTPIEFNVDATIQFNNGNQFSASSIPTINVWDLAPSRMKIWARLTQLKQVFLDYNEDELDIEKIDLKAFYTKKQVDELIKEQKAFTLSKQMKLYDDLIDDNENEIYRGPITNFINKGYIATEYDKETETMILDWPDEIGTLPPEALQNNPQVGDFTHAATADFSAKQQKRITTNENNIKLIENNVDINKQNIDDIKNNWFNIETSPLWKKIPSFIPSSEFGKIYLAIWSYIYQPPDNPTDNYIYSNKKTIFNLNGDINRTTQKNIKLDELIINDDIKIQLFFMKNDGLNDITVVSNDVNYQEGSVILYQYIGTGTPTEFIAEDNNDNDYYTKQETDNLLIKKQDKLIAGDNITIDDNNKISASGGGNIDENRIFNNKKDKDDTTNLVSTVIKVGITKTTYWNNPDVRDDLDIPNKKYVDDAITDLKKVIEKPIKIESKTLLTKEIRENEWEIDLKENPTPTPCPCPKWKEVGILLNNKLQISYFLIPGKQYKLIYNLVGSKEPFYSQAPKLEIIFTYQKVNIDFLPHKPIIKMLYSNIVGQDPIIGAIVVEVAKFGDNIVRTYGIDIIQKYDVAALYKLEELQE